MWRKGGGKGEGKGEGKGGGRKGTSRCGSEFRGQGRSAPDPRHHSQHIAARCGAQSRDDTALPFMHRCKGCETCLTSSGRMRRRCLVVRAPPPRLPPRLPRFPPMAEPLPPCLRRRCPSSALSSTSMDARPSHPAQVQLLPATCCPLPETAQRSRILPSLPPAGGTRLPHGPPHPHRCTCHSPRTLWPPPSPHPPLGACHSPGGTLRPSPLSLP